MATRFCEVCRTPTPATQIQLEVETEADGTIPTSTVQMDLCAHCMSVLLNPISLRGICLNAIAEYRTEADLMREKQEAAKETPDPLCDCCSW